jgi:hypothetical protein
LRGKALVWQIALANIQRMMLTVSRSHLNPQWYAFAPIFGDYEGVRDDDRQIA